MGLIYFLSKSEGIISKIAIFELPYKWCVYNHCIIIFALVLVSNTTRKYTDSGGLMSKE